MATRDGITTAAMRRSQFAIVSLSAALAVSMLAGGCSKQAPQSTNNPQQYPQGSQPNQPYPAQAPNAAGQQAMNPNAAPVQQPANSGYAAQPPAPVERPASYTIPAGTHLRITTRDELGSKISQPGQTFSATVADPITVHGVTLVRAGAPATGTVVDAKSLGRFKGQAELSLRLDSIRADGRTYQVETSSIERVEKGKGKRTATLIGGGGGLGAIIGGIAGGGKGALIGGLAGAGAGTAGTAFTGNKEIVIPAETELTFRLEHSVSVGR